MNRPLSRTIRQKLLTVVLLTTLVALVVGLSAIILFNLRTDRRNFVADMNTQSELLGHMTAPALNFDDKQLALQNLNLLKIRPGVRAAAIYDAQGRLFAHYRAPGDNQDVPPTAQIESVNFDGTALVVSKPIVQDGAFIGTVYLRADFALLDKVLGYLEIASVVLLVAMLSALVFSLPLQRSVTDPVLAIADIARDVVARRDYSRRAHKTSNDEVGALVDSFNNMLAEIERSTRELENSNREIAHEASERSRAQQEVMRLNVELEGRVHERTAQLEETNTKLELSKIAADQANQAKSAFLSSMSHELRTPLNAILGFAQLCGSDSLPVTEEQKKEFITHIIKAGKHLLVLINEVLDLAKVESGTLSLSLEPVSLAEVMSECQTMIAPLAHKRAIQISLPFEDSPWVQADRIRLKQVLLNLLSNAIKYNREGGAVVVSYSEGAVDRVRIAVQDTGAGILESQMSQLFQPFNRLAQENKGEEGTGIGLVVSKRLVELMNGKIGVTSSSGLGSVFWIELRRVDRPQAASPPATRAPLQADISKGAATGTLLYVEDNPANLKLIEEMVGFRSDLQMMTAADANLGIELAQANLPDVILMDINLPGMSGVEALRVLRNDTRTAHIPVIALTANAMPKDISAGMEVGFYKYLVKPVNLDEFYATLDSALEFARTNRRTHGKREDAL
ncbi:MAG TPA: ATP-binding protein [Burkholderiaceae bacterium]|jgi:signal transduction histidine kinase/CheY-like chemotaxis protein